MSDFIENIQNRFRDKKIVIIGDLVADQFLYGTINRVSREAPVFIMRHNETKTLAGGAGNAAVNVSTLGGKAVAVGLVGVDQNGQSLLKMMEQSGVHCQHIVKSKQYQTTTKVRVLAAQHHAQRQQVIRIDYEDKKKINASVIEKLKQNVIKAATRAHAIIISDYSYGVANDEIAKLCVDISKESSIPLLIDSRFRLADFRDMTTATPNQEEVEQILGENFTEVDCANLLKKLNLEALLITKGNQGMLLLEKNKSALSFDAVGSKEPVDVTGAGDTVIATYALSLAAGLSFSESAMLANHAGGIVVMKKGTATVNLKELLESLKKNSDGYKVNVRSI